MLSIAVAAARTLLLDQPWTSSVLTDFGQASSKLGGKHMAKGHEFCGFISGITKHVTLVPSTNLFWSLDEMAMDTLGNIGGLLLNVDKDIAVVSVKTNIIRDKPNRPAG